MDNIFFYSKDNLDEFEVHRGTTMYLFDAPGELTLNKPQQHIIAELLLIDKQDENCFKARLQDGAVAWGNLIAVEYLK